LYCCRENFYADCEGIIFVIDSSDSVRMCVVKDELDTLLQHKDIGKRSVPILFFANKMDLPKSLTPAQVSEALQLPNLTDRPWHIVASNALAGTGLQEGIKWLSEHLPQ
jgi:ADP-ribosylation factor-like protein 6